MKPEFITKKTKRMENKKKPATVILVSSHHSLENPGSGTYLSHALEDYSLYTNHSATELMNGERKRLWFSAIRGLQSLGEEFVITISLDILNGKKALCPVKRTWARITTRDGVWVLTMSHHNHEAFYSIEDWKESEEAADSIIRTWDVADWAIFFRKKILEKTTSLKKKAENLRKEADEIDATVALILEKLN